MRGIFLIGMVLLGFLAPWWLFFPAASLYMLRYAAYELIALGLLLDLSFGIHFFMIPFPCFYTAVLALLLSVAQLGKPLMTFTNSRASHS